MDVGQKSRIQNSQGLYVAYPRLFSSDRYRLILVPLTGVLDVLAIAFFLTSGYYGYRLTKLTRSVRVTMITRDTPISFFRGIILLASSEIIKLVDIYSNLPYPSYFDTASAALFLGSAVIFAMGCEKLLAAYNNEKIRASVFSSLEELGKVDIERERGSEWNKELR
jgi:TRAP-type C4-dicarboxylate transport system permease small subunit